MGMRSRIRRSDFFIKLTSWEYWPFGIVQAPLMVYWLWLSIKARSLFFFSASNPGIFMGGMFGESKFEVLGKIPSAYKPKSVFLAQGDKPALVWQKMQEAGISFPVIFKPDLGERGWMVKKIKTAAEIPDYVARLKADFIAQQFVDLPLEFSVFYARHPMQQKGKVTSITMKKMLTVQGDGKRTIQQLILDNDRAKLQWSTLRSVFASRLEEIPQQGNKIELVSIGNHCLGTTFINRNELITEKLSASFDRISKQVEGFYFGRYDLRAASEEALENGVVQIMELNGCGAEPSHIYHPGASLRKGLHDLFVHWKTIYEISVANHKIGVPYLKFKEGVAGYKRFKAVTT